MDKIPDGQFKTFIAEASSATSSGIMGKAVSGVPLSLQSMATNAVGSSMGDEIGGEASSALDRSTPSVDEAPSSAPHQPAHTSYSSHDAEVDLQNISNINLKIPTLSFKEPVVSDPNYAGYNLGEINRANIQNSQSASVADTSPHSYLDDPVRAQALINNGLFRAKPGMLGVGGFIDYEKKFFKDTANWSSASIDSLSDKLKDMSKGFKEAIPEHLAAASNAAKMRVDEMSAENGFDQGSNVVKSEISIADSFNETRGLLSKFGVFIKTAGVTLDAYNKYQKVKSVPVEQQPAEAFVQGSGFTGEQIATYSVGAVAAPLELPFLVGAGAALLTAGIAGYASEAFAEELEDKYGWFKPQRN